MPALPALIVITAALLAAVTVAALTLLAGGVWPTALVNAINIALAVLASTPGPPKDTDKPDQ